MRVLCVCVLVRLCVCVRLLVCVCVCLCLDICVQCSEMELGRRVQMKGKVGSDGW